MLGILGKKVGMTQIFREDGACVPATSIVAGPCVVVQVKSKDNEGYQAVQLGFADKKEKRATKALKGHFKKSNSPVKRFVREIATNDNEQFEVGQKIEVDIFKEGDFVDVTGTSIGKGFQGGMKRWGWSGGPGSHGSMSHRRPGSIGANTTPGRVLRGHHLPGHMGNCRVTVQSLEIIKVDKENNTLVVKGAVPGHKGSYLIVRKAKKK
ncbi:MAG: 50S ribosomal protein L3 [Candidatus Omnitrophica bacterium]|nr:50S ribosomal protein L3 [Candidatus Omnitrophota bacterium]MCG2702913.1 50S ribosomal protein L3 [Candidatus Omnitrophota bacterium]